MTIDIPQHSAECEYSPEAAQREIYELIVKAGRRCAYDLAHAAGEIDDREMSKHFHARSHMWLDVFYMEDGGKQYRHKLHHIISMQDMVINRYRELAKEHGLNNDFDGELPF